MIADDAGRYGPFKVVVTHNGNFIEFESLVDATRYASTLLNTHNLTTATYNGLGQLVGCTETWLDSGPYDEDVA